MALTIRVTTKADTLEKRKQEHIAAGYRIEDEQPMPVNGLCSFFAVKDDPPEDLFGSAEVAVLRR